MSAIILHNNAVKITQQLHSDMPKLSTGLISAAAVQSNISSLLKISFELELLSKREVTAIKRESTLTKASSCRQDALAFQQQLDTFKAQEKERLAAAQRLQLLGNSNGAQPRSTLAMGRGDPTSGMTEPEQQSTILMMEGLVNERARLDTSSSRIEEYIGMGRNALQELAEQRDIFKNTKKRMLDAANFMGLSSSVIRFIERRTRTDVYVLYGGIFVTTVILVLIVYYLG